MNDPQEGHRVAFCRVLVDPAAGTDTPPVHLPVARNAVEFITEHDKRVVADCDLARAVGSTIHDEPATKSRRSGYGGHH